MSNSKHPTPRKWKNGQIPFYYHTWGSPRIGRSLKRQLSKARRRYAKLHHCYGIPYKSPVNQERECNWKGH